MTDDALGRVRSALAAGKEADGLGAWISRRPAEVVTAEAAAAAVRSLPLAGMTLAVKDNIDVVALTTTAGHPSFARTAAATAFAIKRLVDLGAVVVGKTNMDQFATGLVGTRSPYGVCRNPHRIDRIAGGSSSGSAVAVATGAAEVGISTDTAGSGRVPAALCGIVGLKPTRGLLSTGGVVPAIAGLDCVGVFARTVAVAAAALSAATAFDPHDPWSRRPPLGTPVAAPGRLRIGIPRAPEPIDLDGPAKTAWRTAVDLLAPLGRVVEVDVTAYLEAGALLYGGALVAFRSNSFGDFLAEHPHGSDPVVASTVTAGGSLLARRLAADIEELQRLRRRMEAVWSEVDVLAVPTVGLAPTLAEVAADPVGVNSRLGAGRQAPTCWISVAQRCRADGVATGCRSGSACSARPSRIRSSPRPAPG